MITLKKYNYFTGTPGDVSNSVSKIVRFLEIDGFNPILFCRNTSTIKHQMPNNFEFKNLEHFRELVSDTGNLFRCNLIVLDLWGFNLIEIDKFKSICDDLNIKLIILAKEFNYKTSDDVGDYHVVTKYNTSIIPTSLSFPIKSETIITERINNWTSTLDDLKKSYIRDKKIDSLFDDENE
jgi:hypothetical protein